jgi:hypothetical protein
MQRNAEIGPSKTDRLSSQVRGFLKTTAYLNRLLRPAVYVPSFRAEHRSSRR